MDEKKQQAYQKAWKHLQENGITFNDVAENS